MDHIVIQKAQGILAEGLTLNKYIKLSLRFVNYELKEQHKKYLQLITGVGKQAETVDIGNCIIRVKTAWRDYNR